MCTAELGTLASLRLPDHELAQPFSSFFHAALTPNLPVLCRSYYDLPCCHQPAFLDIWLSSNSFYLSSFTAGCGSLPSKSSAAGRLWGKPPHPVQEEYTGPYLQPDISTISWMAQEYIVPSLLKREFILLIRVRLSMLQCPLLLILLFLFSSPYTFYMF